MSIDSTKGRQFLTCLISGDTYLCPACHKGIAEKKVTYIQIPTHNACLSESLKVISDKFTYNSNFEQMSLFPGLVTAHCNNVGTAITNKKRLGKPRIDKAEFAAFLKEREKKND